jgi:hypothetical protein
MKKFGSKALTLATLVVGLGLASSAHAVWTFTGVSTNTNSTAANPNLISQTGVYVTNGASNAGFASGAAWTSNALQSYPSLGMCTDGCTAPNHAIDNNGNTEAVMIGFSSSVVLSSIGLAYTHNNVTSGVSVDASVFRYVGSSATPTLAGNSASAMAGWELVGNYGDMVQDTSNPYNLVNSTSKGSSWWLISAYNSGFSGAGETRGALDNGNDYFKVYALAGSACTSTVANVCGPSAPNPTPEPTSIALVGVALLGAFGARRRKAAAVPALA